MTHQPSDASVMSDEEQIRALNLEWADAEIKHDGATLKRILDERFVCTWPDGVTVDKASFIQAILSLSMVSMDVSEEIIHIHSNAAVWVGTDAVRYPSAAGDVRLFRITCTFVKRQDQWQAIAEQLAALAPNP